VYRREYEVTPDERARRIGLYWQPYHDQLRHALDRAIAEHGFAVLLDAHSIASRVPNLFEGQLPDLNFGTNHGRSGTSKFQRAIEQFAGSVSGFSAVVNGRFVGGYITRHYGGSDHQVEAVQLEISQAAYLDESTGVWENDRASRLQSVLVEFVKLLMEWRTTGG
jgi:N-formylglutamate amidohydrolase